MSVSTCTYQLFCNKYELVSNTLYLILSSLDLTLRPTYKTVTFGVINPRSRVLSSIDIISIGTELDQGGISGVTMK